MIKKRRFNKKYFFAGLIILIVLSALLVLNNLKITGKIVEPVEGLPEGIQITAGFYLPRGDGGGRIQLFDTAGNRYIYNPYYGKYVESTDIQIDRDGLTGFKPVVSYYFNFSGSEGIDLWDANGNLKRFLFNTIMTQFESVDKTTIGLPSNFKPAIGYFNPRDSGSIVLFNSTGGNWITTGSAGAFADKSGELSGKGLTGFKPVVGYYFNYSSIEGINLWNATGGLKSLNLKNTIYTDLTANKASYGLPGVVPTAGYSHRLNNGNYTIELWDDEKLYSRTDGESGFREVLVSYYAVESGFPPSQGGELPSDGCGDGFCDSLAGENYSNCPQDCFCGDGNCSELLDEDCINCPEDCGSCINLIDCGDGFCDSLAGENYSNCPQDCFCGDGFCDFDEDCFNCIVDCGNCSDLITCGDTFCDFDEDCINCPSDCGICPDLTTKTGQTNATANATAGANQTGPVSQSEKGFFDKPINIILLYLAIIIVVIIIVAIIFYLQMKSGAY